MSLDFKAVEPQFLKLKAYISQVPTAKVAMLTNKRVITCCLDRDTARMVRREIRAMGFASAVEKGRNTSRYYVATSFNYPY